MLGGAPHVLAPLGHGGGPPHAPAGGVAVGGGGGAVWAAAAAVGDSPLSRLEELKARRCQLKAERAELYRQERNEEKRRARLQDRARGLPDSALIDIVVERARAKAKAEAKAKAKAKAAAAKAKAKAKAYAPVCVGRRTHRRAKNRHHHRSHKVPVWCACSGGRRVAAAAVAEYRQPTRAQPARAVSEYVFLRPVLAVCCCGRLAGCESGWKACGCRAVAAAVPADLPLGPVCEARHGVVSELAAQSRVRTQLCPLVWYVTINGEVTENHGNSQCMWTMCLNRGMPYPFVFWRVGWKSVWFQLAFNGFRVGLGSRAFS